MSITKYFRSTALTVIFVTCVSSAIANAEHNQQSGKRRGPPPPEAIEACTEQSEGSACSFSGHQGDVSGICIVPPHEQEELVCAPEGGPPKNRDSVRHH
jgi:hypothetical protein